MANVRREVYGFALTKWTNQTAAFWILLLLRGPAKLPVFLTGGIYVALSDR